jgi:hypothetical protein
MKITSGVLFNKGTLVLLHEMEVLICRRHALDALHFVLKEFIDRETPTSGSIFEEEKISVRIHGHFYFTLCVLESGLLF